MFFVMLCIAIGAMGSEGGYVSHSLPLGIPHPLTINREMLETQLLPRRITYAVRDTPAKDVSYSLSYEDYLYLKQHKVEGKDSPYNPEPTEPSPVINNVKAIHNHAYQELPRSEPSLKRSAAANSINGFNNILVSSPESPEVRKHMYFHVPPPDFEEIPVAPRLVQPAKSNVNILFIKVPSYQSNQGYSQRLFKNSPVEGKTLIYVLSKKENIPQPVVLPPKPPAPEVYFVKYKTSNDNFEAINNELSLPTLLQNVSPVLEQRRAVRDP